MKYLTSLLLFLFTAGTASAATANTILILGDSLSAAYGMPREQGWVTLLQERLAAEQHDFSVVNASISGDTTASGRARLPRALEQHQPDIVILELGGNDGLRGLSIDEMQRNLAAMIETAIRHRARVLLIGVQLPPNYGPRYNDRFAAAYRELARDYGVALLPSLVEDVGTRTDLMQNDGIHPNLKAQALIVARVWEHLLPLLDDPPARVD